MIIKTEFDKGETNCAPALTELFFRGGTTSKKAGVEAGNVLPKKLNSISFEHSRFVIGDKNSQNDQDGCGDKSGRNFLV